VEQIRTRVDHNDSMVREIHIRSVDGHQQVGQNRADIAGIKATAAILGALAGSLFAVVSRFLFLGKS